MQAQGFGGMGGMGSGSVRPPGKGGLNHNLDRLRGECRRVEKRAPSCITSLGDEYTQYPWRVTAVFIYFIDSLMD
jgi:hypothetical protein